MSRKTIALSILLALAITVPLNWFIFYWRSIGAETTRTSEKETPSVLSVAPESLICGDVWQDTRFVRVLQIENRGDKEVAIDKFVTSCSCTAAMPESMAIPPGQSKELRLTVDLTQTTHNKTEEDVESFQVSVEAACRVATVTPAGGGRFIALARWELKGNLKRVLSLSRPGVNFGQHSDRAGPLTPSHVKAFGKVPLQRLAAGCTKSSFSVEVTPAETAGTNPEYTLIVYPKRGLPIGIHRAEVELSAHFNDGRVVTAARLPVEIEIVADIQATPPEIQFGARHLGEQCQEAIAIQSLTGNAGGPAFRSCRFHGANGGR